MTLQKSTSKPKTTVKKSATGARTTTNSKKKPTTTTTKVKAAPQHVTRDMTLGDVVQKHPIAAFVMMSYGLHCIGCHVSAYETVEQGCRGHGMPEHVIDEMVVEINNAVEAEKRRSADASRDVKA